MSATELIHQVAALSPQERMVFEQLLRELENGSRAQAGMEPPAAAPDFLARAKAVWGEKPPGKPLSAIVSEARGGGS
jgi:hypothetical protein